MDADEKQKLKSTAKIEDDPTTQPLPSPSHVQELIHVFGLMFFGYLVGYFTFAIWWIPTASALLVYYRKLTIFRGHLRMSFLQAIQKDEKSVVNRFAKYLPTWVQFPDAERAEWINQTLRQLWPFLEQYFVRIMRTKLEQNINNSLPSYLKGFRFVDPIKLGNSPLRIGSIKCHDKNIARDEIVIDMEVIYIGNCDIEFRVHGVGPVGIKNFSLRGHLRIELKPLINKMPLVGAISFYFLQNPQVDYTLTKLGSVFNLPGLDLYLKKAIIKVFSQRFVLPNKHIISLVPQLDTRTLNITRPIGLIEVQLIEGRHLKSFGDGKLYVNICIGSQDDFTSQSISAKTSTAKWMPPFVCAAPVYYHSQAIIAEVMCKQKKLLETDKEHYLGRVSLSVGAIEKRGLVDQFFDLLDSKDGGSIRLVVTWKALVHDKPVMAQKQSAFVKSVEEKRNFRSLVSTHSLESEEESTLCVDSFSGSPSPPPPTASPVSTTTACLFIHLESAQNLPISTRFLQEPSPQVIFRLFSNEHKSSIQSFTRNPSWNQTFTFNIDNFDENDQLAIEVLDTNIANDEEDFDLGQIGHGSVSLRSLIESSEMTLTKPLSIRCGGSDTFQLSLCISLYFPQPIDAQMECHDFVDNLVVD